MKIYIWIKGTIRSCGILRIFTVASLLFLAPASAGGSNPVGLIFLTLLGLGTH